MAPTATNTASTAATSATAAAATSSASTSSLPTSLEEATQRYHSTKLSLRTGLANKRLIDRSLIDLESQIYLFEGSYLQTTSSSGGNIVKGFDSYLKNSSSSSTSRGGNQNLGAEVPVEDRIFSLSSATYQKSLELKANEGLVDEESKTGELESDTSATPVVKKKKDKEAMQSGSKDSAVKKKKDKERSQTPQVGKTGGKNADAGPTTAGGSTPTKTTTGGGGKASSAGAGAGTATKLKRKNTDGAAAAGSSGASTPSGKAVKRKKDDD
ncbi:Chromatin modification-related protein EAF6 [Pseudozyma hubeiensis]|nr:Chromatin modification-related protein EAF6 [Pseudozyma hubeiensis]